MIAELNRRRILALAAATILAPARSRAADEPITVFWEDLVPKDEELGTFYSTLKELGLLKVGDNKSPWAIQPPAAMVRDFDDKIVRIPGFIVPLGFEGTNVNEGLLVPYVGACIHVPPPPPNQLIYVTTADPWPSDDLWDAIWVTGRMHVGLQTTELAEIGYTMQAELMEHYE